MDAMRFVPYAELGKVPNVIADGHPRRSTVLVLSHWPDSVTPEPLRRDLSAECVLAYLADASAHVDASVVSNNHLDLDGFMSVWALCHPGEALADPTLVAEVSRAGDFGFTHDDRCARIAFAWGALRPEEETQYQPLMDAFNKLAFDIENHEELWIDQWHDLARSEAALQEGRITIEEIADVDLAVVTVEATLPNSKCPHGLQREGPCHPMAIHRVTDCSRVLYRKGDWAGLVYRFESWVRFISRPIPPRIDLTGLALALGDAEANGATWSFAWPQMKNPPVAWLSTDSFAMTSIPHGDLVERVTDHLRLHARDEPVGGPGSYSNT